MSYEVVFADRFKGSVKDLKKRYPNVADDIKGAIRELNDTPDIGKVIPRDYGARKLRVVNSSAKKGKSGGFRLIYFVQQLPRPEIWFLLLYSKGEKEDVSLTELAELVGSIDA